MTAELPSREERIFSRELTKSCFLIVTKRTEFTAPLRSESEDEIMLTVIVYKSILVSFFKFGYCFFSNLLLTIFNISVLI